MDQYQSIRELPLSAIASTLGIDLSRFRSRKGELYGKCPIHSPKNNTTSFSYASDGRFNCFSCSAKGKGAIDLTMQVLHLGFKEAVEKLGGIKPLPDTTKPVLEATESQDGQLKPLLKDTWRKFAVPCPWLEARIPNASIRELYGVYCYNNPARKSAYSGRVMIPIKDAEGILYGYLGRKPGTHNSQDENNSPKYLFPRDFPKSRFLFGSDVLKGGKFGPVPLKRVYLLESPFAVMKFASLGLPALSCFGWSVSSEQLDILTSLTRGVVFLPDRNKYDQAGSCIESISRRLWLRFPPLPVDDPENLSLEQIQTLTR